MAAVSLSAGLEGIEPSDYVFVGLLVVGMAGQYVGGMATDRLPSATGIVGVFVVLAVLALAFVPVSSLGLGPLVVVCGLIGFFLFAIQPFYQNAVAVYTPADGRGLSYGFTYLGEFGFGAASIAIGGFVIGAAGLGVFFAVLAGLALVSASLAALLLFGRDRIDFLESYETEAAD
jgi:predicted MFS family arabinose efflux permease